MGAEDDDSFLTPEERAEIDAAMEQAKAEGEKGFKDWLRRFERDMDAYIDRKIAVTMGVPIDLLRPMFGTQITDTIKKILIDDIKILYSIGTPSWAAAAAIGKLPVLGPLITVLGRVPIIGQLIGVLAYVPVFSILTIKLFTADLRSVMKAYLNTVKLFFERFFRNPVKEYNPISWWLKQLENWDRINGHLLAAFKGKSKDSFYKKFNLSLTERNAVIDKLEPVILNIDVLVHASQHGIGIFLSTALNFKMGNFVMVDSDWGMTALANKEFDDRPGKMIHWGEVLPNAGVWGSKYSMGVFVDDGITYPGLESLCMDLFHVCDLMQAAGRHSLEAGQARVKISNIAENLGIYTPVYHPDFFDMEDPYLRAVMGKAVTWYIANRPKYKKCFTEYLDQSTNLGRIFNLFSQKYYIATIQGMAAACLDAQIDAMINAAKIPYMEDAIQAAKIQLEFGEQVPFREIEKLPAQEIKYIMTVTPIDETLIKDAVENVRTTAANERILSDVFIDRLHDFTDAQKDALKKKMQQMRAAKEGPSGAGLAIGAAALYALSQG